MKVACLQEVLSTGLTTVGRAVGAGFVLPVLSNVLLTTDDGRLKLSATNMEVAITCWISARVEEEGATTVPARLLTDLVNSFPADAVGLALTEATQTLGVKCAHFDSNIKGIDAQEFPAIPSVDGLETIRLEPETLRQMIDQVAFSAATDESRPTLTGVLVQFEDGHLTMAAADGFRLSTRRAILSKPVGTKNIIVPARALKELSRLLAHQEEPVEVAITEGGNQAIFHIPSPSADGVAAVDLVTQLVEGNFPDYGQIIPATHVTRTMLNTAEFLKAVRISHLFARDAADIVRLDIQPDGDGQGSLTLSAVSAELGDNVTQIDATVEGEAIEIAFNAKYLIDVLSVVDAAQVALETAEASTPGVLRIVDDDDFIHVIMPMHLTRGDVEQDDWFDCYKERWRGIAPESIVHPAKFARGLIRRIYRHATEEGWLSPGDVVIDPFAGVALGALDALHHGMHYLGVELEKRFVDMGAGCECTGISKEEWVRFYGRWKRVAHKDGRHWCPQCLEESKRVIDPSPQLSLLPSAPSASYVRNSGQIPTTHPHRYDGNLSHFARHARNGARAVLLQGDSRELTWVVREVGVCVSSPPFGEAQSGGGIAVRGYHNEEMRKGVFDLVGQRSYMPETHGKDPANLGNLPATDEAFRAVVSSPPYAASLQKESGIDAEKSPHIGGPRSQMNNPDTRYGNTDGQLGAMPDGNFQAVVSSPPYAESVASDDPDKRGGLYRDPKRRHDKTLTATYGESDGQLAAMANDGFEAVVSSPPYEGSLFSEMHGIDWHKAKKDYPGRVMHAERVAMHNRHHNERCYGVNSDNLGSTTGDNFWAAARRIVEQVYQVLQPGGHAIWVVKAFVRDGQIVDFPDQWRQLCEACGFVTLHYHRAWLVEDRGTQFSLDGEAVTHTVERKSFFRRLAEKKGSPRIDYEIVLCMVKP